MLGQLLVDVGGAVIYRFLSPYDDGKTARHTYVFAELGVTARAAWFDAVSTTFSIGPASGSSSTPIGEGVADPFPASASLSCTRDGHLPPACPRRQGWRRPGPPAAKRRLLRLIRSNGAAQPTSLVSSRPSKARIRHSCVGPLLSSPHPAGRSPHHGRALAA